MEKQMLITFDESLESRLLALFQDLKVSFKSMPLNGRAKTVVKNGENFEDDDETEEEIRLAYKESIQLINADLRGEIQLKDAWDFLAELKAEAEQNEMANSL